MTARVASRRRIAWKIKTLTTGAQRLAAKSAAAARAREGIAKCLKTLQFEGSA